jgi:hypothetical protein
VSKEQVELVIVPIAVRGVAAAAGAVLVLSVVASVVGTVIVPRKTGSRLTRLIASAVDGIFRLITHPIPSYRRRDRIMAGQAAVMLLGQLAVWLGAMGSSRPRSSTRLRWQA